MSEVIRDSLHHMIIDLLYGDEAVAERNDYRIISGLDIHRALKLIVNNPDLNDAQKKYFLENTWRVNYEFKPPSPYEFLTPKYLGAVGDQIYTHVKKTFEEFLDPIAEKRVLVLSTCIGYGKSLLSTLIAIYIIVHLSYMRDPKKFYGLNQAGSLVVALLSFTQQKTAQILLQPFYNILRNSPIFERTMREDRLPIKQKEIKKEQIAYTSAGRMGSFQFNKDVHIVIQSERAALLGLNIFMGIASEISYWIKKGIAIDEIWGTFNDLRERVNSRFRSRPLSGVILDSSPLDLSLSPIDKWVYTGEAEKDPEVMVVQAKHWDVFPERYPNWRQTKRTFPIYRGSAARPPVVLDESEIGNYAKEDIVQVPIDKKQSFKNNLKKQVADFIGWPAGGLEKLIEDQKVIEGIFSDQLNNIYDYVSAPADENPEDLIWNKIKDIFFIKLGNNQYEFYRSPNAKRIVHVDLSESKDIASFGMSHMELNKKGNNMLIGDFTIPISTEKSRINIDAICDFIISLKKKGRIKLHLVTADRYQSSSILQRIKREGIDVKILSLDRDEAPYRVVSSWMLNNRVKVGRNILLKNNLASLIRLKNDKGHTKIDHNKGNMVYEDGGDWVQSFMGVNAKDVADGFVGSGYSVISELGNEIPIYQWIEYEKKEDEIVTTEQENQTIKDSVLEKIQKEFGLI